MLEPAVIALRLLQYLGAMILMGSSLFVVYAPLRPDVRLPRMRGLLVAAGVLLAVSSLLQIAGQSIQLSGSASEGMKSEALGAVVSYMPQGKAAALRAAAAAAAVLALLFLPNGRGRYIAAAIVGAAATTTLAWMGHAAATEGGWGTVHRISDVLHVLAAAVWIGALAVFLALLLSRAQTSDARAGLHRALAEFAGIGSVMVAILVLTGLVNSWILVGPERLESLWTTPYGRLLALKVLLFLGMLGLATANRYRLTPALGHSLSVATHPEAEIAALRRSIAVEMALGVAVLLLVAWFGTLPPPAAS